MYIKNCQDRSNIKVHSPIEHFRNLKNMCFEIGNFSYTNRYQTFQKYKYLKWKFTNFIKFYIVMEANL
jgi:hypothetical protein